MVAHYLLEYDGTFLNCRDNDGHTPLMWAAFMVQFFPFFFFFFL